MEKIEDKNFLKNLKKNRSLYNDLFSMNLVKYPNLDGELVLRFVSEKIAPFMASFEDSAETEYESLFRFLYEKTLELAGSMKLDKAYEGFGNLVQIAGTMKKICLDNPEDFLKSLFSASENILQISGESFSSWSFLLLKIAMENNIESLDKFLNAGRFSAWISGMASLREKVLVSEPVSEDLMSALFKESGKLNGLNPSWKEIEISPWLNGNFENRFNYKYSVSGFRGFDGDFIRPPVVAIFNGRFLATDGERVFLLFADIFGSLLTEVFTMDPEDVVNESITKIPPHINCFFKGETLPFSDVRSVAITKHTVIISRDSSHGLYVFGNGE